MGKTPHLLGGLVYNTRMDKKGVEEFEALFGTTRPVALVTGAGAPRIGNCVARLMARRGYRVVVHAHRSVEQARSTVAELRQNGCEAISLFADLTDESEVRKLVGEAKRHFGRLDVLANCAAIWSPQPLEEVTANQLRENFDANTLATFLCCQSVGLAMVEQSHGGAIINVGDWAVVRPYPDYSAYFASKGTISTLTRSFAVELAARNPRVRVNAVLPGPVMLPDDLPPEQRQAAIDGTLVKREGRPTNVADAIVFLAENDFVTGVSLPVDGGRTIHSLPRSPD